MGDANIKMLTMEQFLALTRRNQAPGMVKLEIRGNVNFEIKIQFMRELREDTFSGNKNKDAYEHVKRILDIVNLFNIQGVTHDAVMLRVFPITVTRAAKRWVDRLSPGTINTRDLLNWPSFKDSLRRDMKKLKENVHVIQVGWENCRGAHLNKECPMNEEVKSVKKVKYGEFRRPFPNNNGNGARYRIGPPEYYTRVDNLPPFSDPNETIVLGRPFLATIHARIDVFDKEISLGVREDIIVFDMNGKVQHSVVLVENACMINEVQGEESFNPLEIGNDLFSYESPLCLEFKKHNYLCLINQNNEDTFVSDNMQEDCKRDKGMTKIVEPEITTLRLHYCKLLQVLRNVEFEFLPICDLRLRECNGEDRIHGLDERGNIKKWECNRDDERRNEKGKEMPCSDLLLIKYQYSKINDMVRERMYIEWSAENNKHHVDTIHQEDPMLSMKSYFPNSSQENQIKPQSRDYSFKEWLKLKIRHTNVNKTVKNAILNKWVLNYEYELGIGKKGYVLDDIWEKCEQVHRGTMYSWHDEGFEEEEHSESGLDEKYYVETYELK
ncbi:hypothetical protein Tco_1317568 [Tanacetum coccineum]